MVWEARVNEMATNHTKRHIPDGLHPSLTIPASDRFSEMMVSAVRYALGRRTYIVYDTVNYIAHVLPYLQRNDINVIYTDIVEAESENRLGDECDVEDWLYLKKRIEDYTTGGLLQMINSKAKGKQGELEAVRLCRSEGFDCHRTAQYCGNVPEGSADIVGLPLIHVEVKRNEHLNIDDALSQSTRDSGKTDHGIPIVLHRKNNTKWKVTMDAHDWFTLYREWLAGQEVKEK